VIGVLIAAPTPMMRAGLRAMLETDELRVVGEASSLNDLDAAQTDIDAFVIAGELPAEELLRSVVGEEHPAIVVLSDSAQTVESLRSLPLRGWSILPLDASSDELQAAVMSAAQGLVTLSLTVAERLFNAAQPLDAGELRENLTSRELEVLALLSQGLPNKLIARELGISEHTVKFHVSALYTKLGASSRTEAVSLGARHGLIRKYETMQKPRLTYRHVLLYSLSGRRIDPSDDRAGFLKLTSLGRKSGKQRTATLLYFRDGTSYVITASNGGRTRHPGWYFNVRSSPEITIQVKDQQKKAVAEIAGPDKRNELWAKLLEIAPLYAGYSKRTNREIPMVILHPLDER
jgi:deazaflavin-dependent oxidoreductase (nitroreductase family)